MSTLRKAISMNMSFRSRRYKMVETKENEESCAPAPKAADVCRSPRMRRGSKMTQSVRDAVGTLRQKFRSSTRRRFRLGNASTGTPSRRSLRLAGRTPPGKRRGDVQLYEPFFIETPGKDGIGGPGIIDKDWNFETPTRLRHEVEALTANMQALATLTPNTLRSNTRARKAKTASPVLTNGSLKVPRSARRRIETAIY